ncbi:endolytic transglycosylase MltG [Desulfoluna spongiiphila]|uniref:endolytic transglycosylase MltG n=1 Tax=Desulfoluna spongiiphila TaxID=419481 RepID=UPI00125A312F|nr:endolytic transglycosylase MltG [Desulfoluna spongiiphila]VVS91139.1 endolytic murein transglycosylase [Desulfoluna spongiiphila]
MTDTHAKSRTLKLIWPLLLLVVIIVVVTGGAAIHLSRFYHTPQGDPDFTIIYTISRGQSFNTTARQLTQAGLCTSETKLRFVATLLGLDKKIKAGEYRLSGSMTPEAILTVLTSGRVHLRRITIPEGYTVKQIAEVVEKSGLGKAGHITDLCFSEPFIRRMDLPDGAPSLEGYLFPETYLFEKATTEEAILTAMVERFKAVFTQELQQDGNALGLTPNQVVTLASIIEKETGAPFERPVISSVFHNRLKKRMRLETDPTVIYGIKDFNGNITRKDLRRRTPYNTYVIKGLPPGPIASPGLAALTAAVRPDDTPYLYFVSKKDGSHHFSRNLREHNKAVRKYQLRR